LNIDKRNNGDKYYMLAFTGLLPTDNFEFLAHFNPIENLSFVTEITNLKVKYHQIKFRWNVLYELEPK
jgi:hypothetical protein